MKNRVFAFILLFIVLFSMASNFSVTHANGVDSIGVEYGLGRNGVKKGSNYIEKDATLKEGVNGLAEKVLTEYRTAIVGVSGAVSLTFLIFLLINFAKLGSSAGNPQMRQQAIMGIIWCGIACAGVGAIGIFFGFFYNAQVI